MGVFRVYRMAQTNHQRGGAAHGYTLSLRYSNEPKAIAHIHIRCTGRIWQTWLLAYANQLSFAPERARNVEGSGRTYSSSENPSDNPLTYGTSKRRFNTDSTLQNMESILLSRAVNNISLQVLKCNKFHHNNWAYWHD
ncbi:hypothetical protein YC2023_007484 [Brassica napus]